MQSKTLLRQIPKVDELLNTEKMCEFVRQFTAVPVTQAVREVLDELRAEILAGNATEIPSLQMLAQQVHKNLLKTEEFNLKKVINATGTVIHTNLGRAPLSPQVAQHLYDVAQGYSNLEYNLEDGARGSRYSHINKLLADLTGAEDAIAVNNNAAAVLLTLSALCAGGEVVISRGELVEIGGSFRIPEIMKVSGCTLREIGSTNKTHLRDYSAAIGENTTAILKVHQSNYKIIGFTASVEAPELAALAQKNDIVLINDLGSGAFIDFSAYVLPKEPTVRESIEEGVDIVTFSGDKLLGAAQAGFIVGRKKYIDIIKKHPLTRALRLDKLTLAAVEATLKMYVNQTAHQNIPVVKMLTTAPELLEQNAKNLLDVLQSALPQLKARVAETQTYTGGGAFPMHELPGYAVEILCEENEISAVALEEKMRSASIPVIGRIHKNNFLLEMRTIDESEYDTVLKAVKNAFN